MTHELIFANRADRTIKVPRVIAIALSYIFKSPKYIEVSFGFKFKDRWSWYIIEDGVFIPV